MTMAAKKNSRLKVVAWAYFILDNSYSIAIFLWTSFKMTNKCSLIRLKRIYNFLCSMLVFTPFALCFVTLRGVFKRFSELTY
jgi:hypothetical protein